MEGASASSGSSGAPVLAATIVGLSGKRTVAVASAPVIRGKRKLSDVNNEDESNPGAKKSASDARSRAQKTPKMQLLIANIMNQTPGVILNWCTATNNKAVPYRPGRELGHDSPASRTGGRR